MSAIRSAMAMGAHRGILVKTESPFIDGAVTGLALKAAIVQDGSADLVFTGKGAVDTEGFLSKVKSDRSRKWPI